MVQQLLVLVLALALVAQLIKVRGELKIHTDVEKPRDKFLH